MNRTKKIAALALCSAMLLTACKSMENDPANAGSPFDGTMFDRGSSTTGASSTPSASSGEISSASGSTSSTSNTSHETPDSSGSNTNEPEPTDPKDIAINMLASQLSYPDLKVTGRIRWMSWQDIDETGFEAELFKKVYGIPETGDDPSAEGSIFELSLIDYEHRYDSLSVAIASDNSPDFFPFEIFDYPYGVMKNRYNAVDNIVDLNDAKWAATKALNEQFAFNGKHYVAFWNYKLADLMWYKKSNIEAIGADDPQEMFLKGKWDWNAFLDLARTWQQSGTSDARRYATDGWNADGSFVVSTGVPIIGSDGTKLISNLRSSSVEKAITGIVSTLQKEDLRYPRHDLSLWVPNPKAWANDEILFFCGDTSVAYTKGNNSSLLTMAKKNNWADNEIGVVPFPKDPNADKHYVQIMVNAPVWVKGSKNTAGVQAWLDCCAAVSGNSTLHALSNEELKKQGYTTEIIDLLDTLYGYNGDCPVTPIVDFRAGLGPNVSDGNAEDPINEIIGGVYLQGKSFVELRDKYESDILEAMEVINAKL